MRTLATLSLCFCFLAAGTAPVAADDRPAAPPAKKRIENPEFAAWSGFKVGAFVELSVESAQMGSTSTSKLTHKLVELTADKAVIETTGTTKAGGMEYALPATKRDVPKEVEVPDIKLPDAKPAEGEVKKGEETIEVAGKKIACTTFESTLEMAIPGAGTMKTWSKRWTSKEIPGGEAKSEAKTDTQMGERTISGTAKTTVTKFGTGA